MGCCFLLHVAVAVAINLSRRFVPASCQRPPASRKTAGRPDNPPGSPQWPIASSRIHAAMFGFNRRVDLEAFVRALWQVLVACRLISTTLSGMNYGLQWMLLQYFGLNLVEHKRNSEELLNNGICNELWMQKIATANNYRMVWQGAVSEDAASREYMAYLRRILEQFASESRSYVAEDVHNERTKLSTEWILRSSGALALPLELRGTTDVLIRVVDPDEPEYAPDAEDTEGRSVLPRRDYALQDTRVVLQIKKPEIQRYEHCMCQSTGE